MQAIDAETAAHISETLAALATADRMIRANLEFMSQSTGRLNAFEQHEADYKYWRRQHHAGAMELKKFGIIVPTYRE